MVNSTEDAADSAPGDGYCSTGFNNTAGQPACTLRAAIQEANANSLITDITFAMPTTEPGHSGGVWTISPGSVLPSISAGSLVLDATTQPGYATTPVVEIDGSSTGAGGDGFRLLATDVTIRGFAINRFPGDGIEVDTTGSGAVIVGNHIGLDASGLIDRGNGMHGIDLQSGSTGSTVGGTAAADRNVISGNGSEGIIVLGSDGNTIIGNYIGTDATGNAPMPNANDGIHVATGAANNVFGQAGAGNVISGNGDDGIEIDDVSSGNLIQANTIGLGADGTTEVANGRYGVVLYNGANTTLIGGSGAGEGNIISGNGLHGITLDGNSNAATTGNIIAGNLIGTDITGLLEKGNGGAGIYFFGGVNNTTVGGATAGARNVISGNTTDGIYLQDAGTTDTEITGNYIGVDITGNGVLPNGDRGVQIESGANNTIVGGTAAGEGNVISANGNDGIVISDGASPGTGTTGTVIQGNLIGIGADGSTALGNGANGVRITTEDGHRIGGTAAGAGNVIANNTEDGVMLQNATATLNPILGNDIYANGQLGIDLGNDGVTGNDGGDGDSGANDLLNFPEITSATESGGTVTVDFDLDVPAGDYRIEFFDNAVADASGNGEGETYVDFHDVVGHTGGSASYSTTIAGSIGDIIAATATEDLGASYGSTSEFSGPVTVSPSGHLISGTVFEDVVGDVLADGSIGGANNPGASNVDVYVYLDDGDGNLDAGDTLIGAAAVQTDANGDYSVSGLADGDYFVVVDSKTVPSSQDPTANQTDIWAEQTYGPVGGYCDSGIGFAVRVAAGPCYAGITSNISDDFTQWDDREHRALVTVAGGDVTAVDFGFSFNVVVTTNGGDTRDDDAGANRTVQGSLRQFIQNANAISGVNTMRFVPTDPAGATDGGGNTWWSIGVTDLLPTVTDDGTTIDGRAFDFTDGTTLLDTNTAQIGANVAVGTAGTFTTPALDPELEIRNDRGTAVLATGLVFEATDSTLRHVSIWGFGDAAGTFDANVRFGTNFGTTPNWTGALVEFNVIGTGPASFTDPGAGIRSDQKNLTVRETDDAIVRDNLIGFAGGVGVDFNTAATAGTVLRNEVRRNGLLSSNANPVGVWYNGTVTGNLIADNASGIYSGPTLSVTYQDNTITQNGWGATRPSGIQVTGAPTTIRRNVISANAGAGVTVDSTDTAVAITSNSIHGNGTLTSSIGIDLLATGDDLLTAPFVTPNDVGDGDTGANDLLNYPVITSAIETAGTVSVLGTFDVPAGDYRFEIFVNPGGADPSGHGEGETFVGTSVLTHTGSGDEAFGAAFPGSVGDVITVTITEDFSGSYGSTSEFSAAYTVTSPNSAPTANDDAYGTLEDTVLNEPAISGVLANDTDPDADSLTATLVAGPGSAASFTLNPDGSFDYTPLADFNGIDTFTYRAYDGALFSTTATVTITVTAVNDEPGFTSGGDVTVLEDSGPYSNAWASAISTGPANESAQTAGFNITANTNPSLFAAAPAVDATGTLTFTPAADANGSADITIELADNGGTTNGGDDTSPPVVFTITIDPVNDAPGANNDTYSTAEDTTLNEPAITGVLANDTDIETDPLTATLITPPGSAASFTLNPDGSFDYTPLTNFNGIDTFTYRAYDGNDFSTTATATITVTPVPDDPIANDDTDTTPEDTAVDIDVLANDTDGDSDPLVVDSVTQASNGTVVNNGTDVTYTPDLDFNGIDTFTYTVTDGNGGFDTATVTVTVGAVNDAPTAIDDVTGTLEDNAVVVDVLANDTDTDLDPLAVDSITQGTNGTVLNNGTDVTYTPNADWNGVDTFTYTVTDGNSGFDTATVTITVTAVNDEPGFTSGGDVTVLEDSGPYSNAWASAISTGPANESAQTVGFAITANTNPSLFAAAPAVNATGTLTFTPAANANGSADITIELADNGGTTNGGDDTSPPVVFTITIDPVNDAPVANNDTYSTAEDTTLNEPAITGVLANDTDIETDPLTATLITPPGSAALIHPQPRRLLRLHPTHQLQRHRHLHLPRLRRQRLLHHRHRHHHRHPGPR